jgi:hypothetical protein
LAGYTRPNGTRGENETKEGRAQGKRVPATGFATWA